MITKQISGSSEPGTERKRRVAERDKHRACLNAPARLNLL